MKKLSKKTKVIIIICVSIVILLGIALGGFFLIVNLNKKQEKIKLHAPTISYESNENGKYLVANNNVLASGYAFYVCFDSSLSDDIYEYIEFKTDKYYLEVSNIFTEAKDYYFYGRCLGNEKYENSDISTITKFSNMHDLSTPNLAISETEISWTAVNNAVEYKIYDDNNVIYTTTQTSYNLYSYINSRSKDSFNFSVRAIGGTNYFDSLKSNVVGFIKQFKLGTVSNLQFNSSTKILTWSSVSNATSYKVQLSTGEQFDCNKNSIDLSSVITEVGVYTFKVKAIGSGNYNDGEYSESIKYTLTKRLDKVTNLRYININENQISVVWDAVEEAQTYTIKINGETKDVALSTNGYTFTLDENESTYIVEVVVNGYGYNTDSIPVTLTINI